MASKTTQASANVNPDVVKDETTTATRTETVTPVEGAPAARTVIDNETITRSRTILPEGVTEVGSLDLTRDLDQASDAWFFRTQCIELSQKLNKAEAQLTEFEKYVAAKEAAKTQPWYKTAAKGAGWVAGGLAVYGGAMFVGMLGAFGAAAASDKMFGTKFSEPPKNPEIDHDKLALALSKNAQA